jgi:hypothetical protein
MTGSCQRDKTAFLLLLEAHSTHLLAQALRLRLNISWYFDIFCRLWGFAIEM